MIIMDQYFLPRMLTPPVSLSKICDNQNPQAFWASFCGSITSPNGLGGLIRA